MAKANKAHLFKACFVHTGMLSDETYDKPQEELDEIEWKMGKYLSSAYKLHAKNFEQQLDDYELFPGKAPDAILMKVPPTCVWTSEFDFYKKDNIKYA